MVKVSLRRAAGKYLFAAALTGAALWADVRLARWAGPRFLLAASSVAIALSAWAGGLGPALLSTLLSAALGHRLLLGSGTVGDLPITTELLALTLFVGAW